MISLTLTDTTTSATLEKLEVPLTETIIEAANDTITLDNNLYTDFNGSAPNKRKWDHTWEYLDKETYDILRGFYDRQFTLFKFPLLGCDYYSIVDVPVRMYLTTKKIINNCGGVQGVQVVFRETSQLSETVSA